MRLNVTVLDQYGEKVSHPQVTWRSQDTKIVAVDPTGLVTGVGTGVSIVNVSTLGMSASAQISVLPAILLAGLYPPWSAALIGDTFHLNLNAFDLQGRPIPNPVLTWSSLDTVVASVDATGLVRGLKHGTTVIQARAQGQVAEGLVVVAPPVLVGAGDIAYCATSAAELTAELLDTIGGVVFTAGDNAYLGGTSADFANCYAPTWGRHRLRTRPSPGNHDYMVPNAAAYFEYFGTNAGDPDKGYYSYDFASWHVVVINTSADASANSSQVEWLKNDLAAHPALCTVAYFHFPRFSSGNLGSYVSDIPVWQALFDAGADVVISGHDHTYERFAPQTPTGTLDTAKGIREFVVGTGGRSHFSFPRIVANSEVRNNDSYGILKLTLRPDGYDWQFIPVHGATFTDSGSALCH